MRKPFPPEFRRDVIAVARKSQASIAQVSDLVDRQFTSTAPSVLWLTDIAEHRTSGGSRTSARSRTSTPAGSSATPSTRE